MLHPFIKDFFRNLACFRSIERHLSDVGYQYSITKDDAFRLARKVLESKQKILKSEGHGNRAFRTDALTPDEENQLWEKRTMGSHAPKPLLRALWYLTTKLMGNWIFFN